MGTRLKSLELCVRRFFTHNSSLITHNQSGFAIIPLLVLALIGITAGTYLVQNRTNLTPFAQGGTDCKLINVKNFEGQPVESITLNRSGFVCDSNNRAYIYYCDERKGLEPYAQRQYDPICKALVTGNVSTERCDGTTAIHVDGSRTDCASKNMICQVGSGGKADSGQTKYAQGQDLRVLGIATQNPPNYAYCVGSSCSGNKVYEHGEGRNGVKDCEDKICKETRWPEADAENPKYDPFIWSPTTASCEPPPAAQPPAAPSGLVECNITDFSTEQSMTQKCSKYNRADLGNDCTVLLDHCDIYKTDKPGSTEVAYTKGTVLQCKQELIENRGKTWCKINPPKQPTSGTPVIQAQKCSADVDDCKQREPNSIGCYMIEGKKRCIFDQATCSQADTNFCKNPPDPRDGCEVKNAVIAEGSNRTSPIQYTQCTPARSGAPAPAPATGTSTSSSGGPSSSSPSSSGTTLVTSKEKVNVTDCSNKDHKDFCFSTGNAHGIPTGECYTIKGEPKCRYSASIKECTKADKDFCVSRGGCVLETVPTNKGDIQFSRCADARSAPNADGSAGSPVGSSSGTPTASAGCEDAKDEDGLTIPCYKIGVFSPEELEATQAHARVALARYDAYKKILSEVKSDVDAQIAAKAEEKIRLAEEKAQACLK